MRSFLVPLRLCTAASAQTTHRLSAEAYSSSGVGRAAMSSDGRFIAFTSAAPNQIPGLVAGGNCFVRDVVSESTELVSITFNAGPADVTDEQPAMTPTRASWCSAAPARTSSPATRTTWRTCSFEIG